MTIYSSSCIIVIITQMSDNSLIQVSVLVAHHLSIISHDQHSSSIHPSCIMTFLMTDDPEMGHHATVSDRKKTCTIVFTDTKGGIDI